MFHNIDIREVVDLSIPLKSVDAAVHPSFPQPQRKRFSSIKENGFNSYVWTFVEHAGTHVDAPNHFVEEGATIDQVSLSQFIGPGVVLDFRSKPPKYPISKDDLFATLKTTNPNRLATGWVVLLLTGYSSKVGSSEWLAHPGLTEEAAKLIVELGAVAVGIDAPTVDLEIENSASEPAHVVLLSHSVLIYENLTNLERLIGKKFLFVGCPILLVGSTGSPVRAMALVSRSKYKRVARSS